MGNGLDDDGPSVLWQLQQYQMVVRDWQPHLTSNEFAVVMQILDRTVGWRKTEATFRSSKLLEGDRIYGGLGRAMVRSTMMKVLRVLEDRGVVIRRRDYDRPWLREYSLDLDWVPDTDWAVGEISVSIEWPSEQDWVSTGDTGVRETDEGVSYGAQGVSWGDPREEYRDNGIGEPYLDNSHRAFPSPPAPEPRSLEVSRSEEEEAAQARPLERVSAQPIEVNPRPRRRPV